MLELITKDFLFLWATIDPIGTLVIFTALTKKLSAEQRKKIALKSILYAAAILVGAIIIGQILLTGMGVRLISFQVAGGIILFLFALQMIFTDFSPKESEKESTHSIAVFPLAIPSIATPGAIMAVILLTDNHIYDLPQQSITTAVLLSVLGITYCMMLVSEKILKFTGQNGADLLVKVMGMLLAALSVELIIDATGIFAGG